MVNPFCNDSVHDATDTELVEKAQNGDRHALEKLILRHQAWIFNIAIRMVFNPSDAEEVTQEVLIKVITKLSQFRKESSFRTWLYRIAFHHVLNMKRRSAETETTTFSSYGNAINATPDLDLPDPDSIPVDLPMLVEEAKVSCTTGMLLCLDRKQRLVFILGAIFGVSDTIGGEVLEISADNFRQLLSRARRDLHQFMNNQCGLLNPQNPCRCPKKTRGFVELGHIDPNEMRFAAPHLERVKDMVADSAHQIDKLVDESVTDIYRDHRFLQPKDESNWLRQLLDRTDVRAALHLN